MSYALTRGMTWNTGYRIVSIFQVVLTIILVFSLPLWKDKRTDHNSDIEEKSSGKPLKLKEVISLAGAKEAMVFFFCYCAIEQTAILWGASYMVIEHGVSSDIAASFASFSV